MKISFKIIVPILSALITLSCNDKKAENGTDKNVPQTDISLPINKDEESIEGIYKTAECDISLEITKIKNEYQYFLKTNIRMLKGKATFSKNESGEKYLVLEGIQWDEYEGDISNEEENDSVTDSKPKPELEIPVGIDASYVKDTLTIQNYGNSMNSYTKISECGLKYIQLIKQ